MKIETARDLIVRPTLAYLTSHGVTSDKRAEQMLLAIALQESGLAHRVQISGPARGLWQFERIGVVDVLTRPASKGVMAAVCLELVKSSETFAVFGAISWNDPLACSVARMALWLNPAPLPALGDEEGAWHYYLRTWRPGKPRPQHWSENFQDAYAAVVA